jgi:uncharacterized protein (TIGR03086 family)
MTGTTVAVHNVNFRPGTGVPTVPGMDLYALHRAVVDFTATVLARIDMDRPATPTAIGWPADELIDHLVTVNAMCANATRQIGPEHLGTRGVPLRTVPEKPLQAWRRTAEAFSTAFTPEADNLDTPMPTPLGRAYPGHVVLTQGTLENLIHAWDLGPVLATPVTLPADLVAEALGRILEQPELYQEFRDRGSYAAPLATGPAASPQDRLLAYLGRDPAATPGRALRPSVAG